MTSPALQYLRLNDFTPGIRQRLLSATSTGWQPAQPGSAQADGTYRCIALPGGGLAPLPRRTTFWQIPSPDGAANVPDGYHVVGMLGFGPVLSGSPPDSPDEIHLCVEWITSGTRKFRWYRIRAFDGSGVVDTLRSINSTEPNPSLYWGTSLVTQRMRPENTLLPGYPVVGCSWGAGGGGYEKFVAVYPDPTNATTAATNNVYNLSTTRFGSLVAHQARLVLLEHLAFIHGTPPGATGASPTNEQISYTSPNNYDLGNQQTVFMSEWPNGYGAYGSISAGELLLVKNQGGGVLISGDIASPTVTRLPGVVSTGNIGCRAAATAEGLLYYANHMGIYAWRGGDTSQKISTVLDDDFCIVPAAASHKNERVFLSEWGDWCLVSNNWLLDLTTMSWWRLEDPAVVQYLHVARAFNSQWMFCSPAVLPSGAAAKDAVFVYDRAAPAHSWSWKGHPLWPTGGDRTVDLREVVLFAQGTGSVQVDLFNQAGAPVFTKIFTLSGPMDVPQMLRANCHVHGVWAVTVRLQADGGADPAPVVYEVRIGWQERTRRTASAGGGFGSGF